MTRIIKQDEFINAVREVLAERGPDFVYDSSATPDETCRYSEDGGETGSCLFGAALIDKLHVPYLESWEGAPIYAVIRQDLPQQGVIIHPDPELMQVLGATQELQDRDYNYFVVMRAFEDGLRFAGIGPDAH